jgi:hypothetical protein
MNATRHVCYDAMLSSPHDEEGGQETKSMSSKIMAHEFALEIYMKEYIQNGNTEMCSLQQGKKDRQLDSSGDGISGLKPAVSLNIFTKSSSVGSIDQSSLTIMVTTKTGPCADSSGTMKDTKNGATSFQRKFIERLGVD